MYAERSEVRVKKMHKDIDPPENLNFCKAGHRFTDHLKTLSLDQFITELKKLIKQRIGQLDDKDQAAIGSLKEIYNEIDIKKVATKEYLKKSASSAKGTL